jgi:D-sedoheptulose 7-phosphate isomerase
MNLIQNRIQESIDVKSLLLEDNNTTNLINTLAFECLNAIKLGNKIIFAGNGGSFGDAQHLSAEFVSRFLFDREPMASVVLGANSSSITAIGNDYGYDHVFSRELKAIGRDGDIVIAISTSGNSSNIISLVKSSLKRGYKTYALTGKSGGKLNNICECIKMPSSDTARIQECHILIGHIICEIVEHKYFNE